MKGYDVVTSDGKKIGKVVDTRDSFLVVDTGFLRGRRPLPQEFAHTTDEERRVVVTVPQSVLHDAPRVKRDGTFDADEASRHYGLGAVAKEETVWPEEATEHQRAEQHQRAVEETGVEPEGAAPLTPQPEDEIERRPERVYMPGGK